MKAVFTPRRMYLRLGLFSFCLCLTALVASVLGMYVDCPPDRRLFGILFLGVGYGFMAALGGWMVLAYFRETVAVDGEEVRVTYVLGRRSFRIGEVTRARWRKSPRSARLQLLSPEGKVVLWLDNFRADRRVRLIHFLRERLSPGIQEGWGEEWERYMAAVVQAESVEERDKFLKSLWRIVAVSPVIGLGCGLALWSYAAQVGVTELPTWSGSVLLDWAGIGILAVVGFMLFLSGMAWLTGPER